MVIGLACAPGSNPEAEAESPPAAPASAEAPRRLRARVEATYPHDPAAFTQGLLWHDGVLYESIGLWGRSAF